MPIIIIPIIYISFYLVSGILYNEKNKRYLLVVIIGVVILFSNYSLYANEAPSTLWLLRSWDCNTIISGSILIIRLYY